MPQLGPRLRGLDHQLLRRRLLAGRRAPRRATAQQPANRQRRSEARGPGRAKDEGRGRAKSTRHECWMQKEVSVRNMSKTMFIVFSAQGFGLLHTVGPVQTWFLVLAYDGTDFAGWQRQAEAEALSVGRTRDLGRCVFGPRNEENNWDITFQCGYI